LSTRSSLGRFRIRSRATFSVGGGTERCSQFSSLPVTIQTYRAGEAETVFGAMSALRSWECTLTGDGEPERLGGARVSTNFFSFLVFCPRSPFR
jgi:hypothetical protein